MRRRDAISEGWRVLNKCFSSLVTAVALSLVTVPVTVDAQPTTKVRRIGYLGSGSPNSGLHEPFRQGLREFGWVEGQNIAIDYRFADGRFDRLPELAAELVQLKVDLIVAQPTPAALAAKNATKSIPIVMINVGGPVAIGLVASLAQPGGNVTGTAFDVELATFAKALELLKVAVPKAQHVAVLSNPDNPGQVLAIKYLKIAAKSLGLRLLLLEVRGPDEFNRVFAEASKERVDALNVVTDSLFILHRTAVADLALKHRLPSMFGVRESVAAGGFMSYGPSLEYNSRRAATFADKILKGAKPADLPVEQPTMFELVVNLKTAGALGLVIPPSLRQRADELIP
jgi:putative tryptophan/tyrosine transport system substrate-binding protein